MIDKEFKRDTIHISHWCVFLNKNKRGKFCTFWFNTKIDYQFDCKNCNNIQFEW